VAVLCMADAGDDASGGARSEARGQSVWWNFLYIFLIILTVNRIKIEGGVDPTTHHEKPQWCVLY
jgi:hypothetical protein